MHSCIKVLDPGMVETDKVKSGWWIGKEKRKKKKIELKQDNDTLGFLFILLIVSPTMDVKEWGTGEFPLNFWKWGLSNRVTSTLYPKNCTFSDSGVARSFFSEDTGGNNFSKGSQLFRCHLSQIAVVGLNGGEVDWGGVGRWYHSLSQNILPIHI